MNVAVAETRKWQPYNAIGKSVRSLDETLLVGSWAPLGQVQECLLFSSLRGLRVPRVGNSRPACAMASDVNRESVQGSKLEHTGRRTNAACL